MEGKETRFGIAGSVLAAVTTSNGATGSYNAMHDSFTPLGGTVPLVNMLLGEIVFGGLGTGLYSMVLVALIALFVAGLMVGRTPEYLGKQLTVPEMKLIALYAIIGPLFVLSPHRRRGGHRGRPSGADDEHRCPRPQRDPRRLTRARWRTTARTSPG